VAIAATADDRMSVAALLYRQWFNPVAGDAVRGRRPLAGTYRAAHAGSAGHVRSDGVSVVTRHDVIGADGWWRTWGESWTPPRTRPGSVRLLLTPHPDALGRFVRTVTEWLLPLRRPWSLACAIDARRMARCGGAVVDVPGLDDLPAGLLDALAPLLRPVVPPLCLPVAAGVGAAEYPDNGMTFGEHRCHLVALALRRPSRPAQPLRSIAAVFTAHGIDPARPHRSR
jgi:hypothetical protein